MPQHWTGYAVDYRFRDTTYRLQVELADDAPTAIVLDGRAWAGAAVPLVDDGKPHTVRVRTPRSHAVPAFAADLHGSGEASAA